MLGFQTELKGEPPEADEGADTKNLSKRQLYDQLNKLYKLPPVNGRNVHRKYLLRVHRGDVFRCGHREYKVFEIDLTPDQLKKTVAINSALVVKKVNILLSMQQKPDLGFTHQNLPETDWLVEVARFIDPTNLLELFSSPVTPEPPAKEGNSALNLIYNGRKFASEYIFRNREVQENKDFWNDLAHVSDIYRYLQALRLGSEMMEEELRKTMEKVRVTENSVNDLVSKAALTFTSIERPDIKSEMIMGVDSLSKQQREHLLNNARLYEV